MKIRNCIMPAIAAFVILGATSASAAIKSCVIKHDMAAEPATSTLSLCTTNADPADAAKSLISFTEGGPFRVVMLVDQANEAALTKIDTYQVRLTHSANFAAPTDPANCDGQAPNWNTTTPWFPTLIPSCPFSANPLVIDMSGGPPLIGDPPISNQSKDIPFFRVTYDNTACATGTIDFTNSFYQDNPGGADITSQVTPMNANVVCTAVPVAVKTLTGTVTAGGGTPTCAGTPPAGTSTGITISFTKPTQCESGGATVACPATCTPGVKVEMVTPTPGVIADNVTTSSVTDTTPRTTGVAVSYKITGVCTNGSGGAGTGASNSSNSLTSNSYTPVCGVTPTITASSVKIGSKDADSITSAADCAQTFLLEGQAATVSGTIVDSDSTLSQETVTLAYGNGDSSPAFPGTAVTASPGTDGKFSVTIPGTALKSGTDLYFAVWATDTTMPVAAAYPTAYAGGVASAKMIPGACIGKGTRFEWAEKPYPNQMPFRSAGQILHIGFKTNEQAAITMRIYSPDGTLVRQIENGSADPFSQTGINSCKWDTGCSWDGTNYLSGSNYVANGMYIVNFYAVDTGTSWPGQVIDYTKGIVVMK